MSELSDGEKALDDEGLGCYFFSGKSPLKVTFLKKEVQWVYLSGMDNEPILFDMPPTTAFQQLVGTLDETPGMIHLELDGQQIPHPKQACEVPSHPRSPISVCMVSLIVILITESKTEIFEEMWDVDTGTTGRILRDPVKRENQLLPFLMFNFQVLVDQKISEVNQNLDPIFVR